MKKHSCYRKYLGSNSTFKLSSFFLETNRDNLKKMKITLFKRWLKSHNLKQIINVIYLLALLQRFFGKDIWRVLLLAEKKIDICMFVKYMQYGLKNICLFPVTRPSLENGPDPSKTLFSHCLCKIPFSNNNKTKKEQK